MANRICQFAKNRTDIKIIKFGPQSEFCKSLLIKMNVSSQLFEVFSVVNED
jgi:hypothetical protein